jgi:hypothetical protein
MKRAARCDMFPQPLVPIVHCDATIGGEELDFPHRFG